MIYGACLLWEVENWEGPLLPILLSLPIPQQQNYN